MDSSLLATSHRFSSRKGFLHANAEPLSHLGSNRSSIAIALWTCNACGATSCSPLSRFHASRMRRTRSMLLRGSAIRFPIVIFLVALSELRPLVTIGTDPVMIRSATHPLASATAALAVPSRSARPYAGFARRCADSHRESDRSLREVRTGEGSPSRALQLSPPHRLLVTMRSVSSS